MALRVGTLCGVVWLVALCACSGAPAAGIPDAGPGGNPDAGPGNPPPAESRWLTTRGNRIVQADGGTWHGRGVNVPDTRSCNACTYEPPSAAEVKRRIDEAVRWGATFLRLDLESYAAAEGRVHWKGLLQDATYLADIEDIVRHVGTHPGVYVMVTLWHEPTVSAQGWPTAQTREVWRALAARLVTQPHVLFGLVNEPEQNFDGAQDAAVWSAMNDTVAALREVEAAHGSPKHLVAVQGTGGWSRRLDYYTAHPITAGGGENVVYEVHVYDPESEFERLFVTPSRTLPVIIGEFGPADGFMTLTESSALIREAQAREVPWLAWTLHPRCAPNLLVDDTGGGCGVGMALEPTAFGKLIQGALAQPY